MRISDWSSDVCSSDLAHRVMRNDDRLFDVLHLVVDAMHAMQPATMLFAYRRTGPRRSALIATTHVGARAEVAAGGADQHHLQRWRVAEVIQVRKSTRLNSSH